MRFFVLQNPKADRGSAVTDYGPVNGSTKGDAPRCPVCGKFIGMLPLLPPVRVELEAWGVRWGDVAFGPGDQVLISSKMRRLFTEAGLVGFVHFYPAEIMKAKKHQSVCGNPPDYLLASIQRSRAAIDAAASGLVRDETPTCQECRTGGIIQHLDRVVLEANTWSYEDVFFARGLPGVVLATERFERLCDDNGLANCCLIAAENFALDYRPQSRSI